MDDATARLTVRAIGAILPSNVGDAVLALPVVAELAARFPKARVTLAGGERARLVFDGDARVHAWIDYGSDGQDWRDRLEAIRQLRRQRFDLLIDLRHTALPWVARARHRTQPWWQPPAALLHRHDRYAWQLRRLLRAWRLPPLPALTADDLWAPRAQERQVVDDWWRSWGLAETDRVVVISPGARSDDKRWPAAAFAATADRVARAWSATVVLTGEPREAALIEDVARQMRTTPRSLVGQTSVRTLALALQRCAALIANDSATLHVASSVNTPTVALFGPTDPAKYGPRSDRALALRRQPMAAITPDDVYAAVQTVLRQSPSEDCAAQDARSVIPDAG